MASELKMNEQTIKALSRIILGLTWPARWPLPSGPHPRPHRSALGPCPSSPRAERAWPCPSRALHLLVSAHSHHLQARARPANTHSSCSGGWEGRGERPCPLCGRSPGLPTTPPASWFSPPQTVCPPATASCCVPVPGRSGCSETRSTRQGEPRERARSRPRCHHTQSQATRSSAHPRAHCDPPESTGSEDPRYLQKEGQASHAPGPLREPQTVILGL